jgi:hypothetical protein
MKRLLALGSLAAVTMMASGCASSFSPQLFAPRYRLPAQAFVMPPVGRWDQVLSLEPRLLISVWESSGVQQTGRFVTADMDALQMFVQGAEVTIPRHDIMRVDLAQTLPGGDRTRKRIAAGAALGAIKLAAAFQIIPLAFAGKLWMPPAGLWLAGAGAGAWEAGRRDHEERRPRTLYIAPARRI